MKKNTPKKVRDGIVPRSKTVPVLYQKIAGEIYAFAHVDGELYFGKVPIKNSVVDTQAFENEFFSKEAA